jgi:hypothetical protein
MPRPKAQVPSIHLRITLTLHPERDAPLIAFLRDQPRRGIARAVKQALLTGVSPLSVAGQRAQVNIEEVFDSIL